MKNKGLIRTLIIIGVVLLILLIPFLYYKGLYDKEVKLNQDAKKAWADVESTYQRRADLIPNLVNTVKGYAEFEQETLIEVVQARASTAQSIKIDPNDLTPENIAKFQDAQAGLSSALSKLMVVIERYPDLKANQNFLSLQSQLEGTENRINVARIRFNEAVSTYNSFALKLLVKMFLHPEEKGYFEADEGAETVPEVQF
jgi:LemA protein